MTAVQIITDAGSGGSVSSDRNLLLTTVDGYIYLRTELAPPLRSSDALW
jgi:hypothetical protein